MATRMLSLIRRLARDRRAISAVETALTVPVVLMAVAIGYDLSIFGNTQSRVREAAFRVADFAASDDGLGTVGNADAAHDRGETQRAERSREDGHRGARSLQWGDECRPT